MSQVNQAFYSHIMEYEMRGSEVNLFAQDSTSNCFEASKQKEIQIAVFSAPFLLSNMRIKVT